jgi:hypothetical protein
MEENAENKLMYAKIVDISLLVAQERKRLKQKIYEKGILVENRHTNNWRLIPDVQEKPFKGFLIKT